MSRGTDRVAEASLDEAATAELLDIGFPKVALEHAARAREAGLFSTEPPPDLIESTIRRCREALAHHDEGKRHVSQAEVAKAVAAFLVASADLEDVTSVPETPRFDALAYINRFASECMAAAEFVHATRKRPVVVVDDHDVVKPAWWINDTGFGAMRDAIKSASSVSLQIEAPPSAFVMVPHSNPDDYSDEDILALTSLLEQSNSDVWIVPRRLADQFTGKSVLVVGNNAHTFHGTHATPWETVLTLDQAERMRATEIRVKVEQLTAGITERWVAVDRKTDAVRDVRSLLKDADASEYGVKVV